MKVRCISSTLTEQQIAQLGPSFVRSQSFEVRRGRTYVPITLLMHMEGYLGHGTSVGVALEGRYLHYVPLILFEIVETSISPHWQISARDGDVLLAPPSMHDPYYQSKLADGFPEYVEDFQRVRRLLGDVETHPDD